MPELDVGPASFAVDQPSIKSCSRGRRGTPVNALPSRTTSFRAHSLVGWLDEPSSERGVRFARSPHGWDFWSWGEIAAASRDIAARITDEASQPTGVVAIVAPNGPEFIAAFYGSLLAGLTPCPLAPPKVVDDIAQYQERIRRLVMVADPVCVLTADDCSDAISRESLERPVVVLRAERNAADSRLGLARRSACSNSPRDLLGTLAPCR